MIAGNEPTDLDQLAALVFPPGVVLQPWQRRIMNLIMDAGAKEVLTIGNRMARSPVADERSKAGIDAFGARPDLVFIDDPDCVIE